MTGTRAFIAIEIDASLKGAVKEIRDEIDRIGITTPVKDGFHFTLFFFEDLNETQINLVKAAMRIARRDEFAITLKGVNFFMHRNDPQVVYIGIEHSDALVQLYSLLNRALTEAGITTDRRPFLPHLTLGRVKHTTNPVKRENLLALRQKYAGKEFGSFICKNIILKKSTLKSDGPVYENLYKVDFD